MTSMTESSALLGRVISEHRPSASFGRGWPAFLLAAALSVLMSLGFGYWGLSVEDGPSLRILGGAIVMAAFAAAMVRTAMTGMRSRVWIFERGLVVWSSSSKVLFCWEDVDAWAVHVVPGLRNTYEADFGNVVQLTLEVDQEVVIIPDQLAGFRAIHDTLREQLEVEPDVVRQPTR